MVIWVFFNLVFSVSLRLNNYSNLFNRPGHYFPKLTLYTEDGTSVDFWWLSKTPPGTHVDKKLFYWPVVSLVYIPVSFIQVSCTCYDSRTWSGHRLFSLPLFTQTYFGFAILVTLSL